MAQQLETLLQQGSADVGPVAKSMGPAAIPILMKHRQAESEITREAVLEGFAALGDDKALEAIAEGLNDENVSVRASAANLLYRNATPKLIPRLHAVLAQSSDANIRGRAALTLGRLNNANSIAPITKQLSAETDAPASKQMQLALARLGEQRYIDAVVKALQTRGIGNAFQDARARYNAVADFEYLHNAKLLPQLAPLLDDREQVANLGSEPYPVWHRVCDRAIDAIPVVTGRTLPFTTGGRNYSDAEIQQAREFIRQTSSP